MTDSSPDLLALVRRGAAPSAASLRDRGEEWRVAEQALAAEIQANPRAAARLVRTFARLAQTSGEAEPRGRAARLSGSHLAYLGRYAESARRFARAAALLTGVARDHARLGLAVAWARSGRPADAAKQCRAIRRSAIRRGDAVLAASADLNAGLAIHEHGRPGDAIPLYRRARAAFAVAGHAGYAAVAAQNEANALVLCDRYEEAEPLYAEASEALRSAGAAHEAARVRYNRGALLVALDRLGDAERELADSERDLSAAGDSQLAALARLDRGEALLRSGLVPQASRVLDSAANSLGRAAPANEVFRARWLRARAAIARDDPESARRILGSGGPIAWKADCDEMRGLAFAAERRHGPASRLLERAATGYGATRPSARARALCAGGWCALELGDLARARRHARTAGRIAARLGVASLSCGADELLFLVEDAAGRRREAGAALERALATLETSRENRATDAMRAALLRGCERWFARAVRHLLDGPDGERRALALVERWRARALVDLMSSCARIEDAGGRLAMLRARVAVLDRRAEGAVAPSFLRATGTAAAPRATRDLARAERRLEEAVARELKGAGGGDFTVEGLRRALPESTALVSLFADDRGGLAFVVRRDGIRVVPLAATDEDLESLVEELYFRFGRYALGPRFVDGHRRRLAAETDRLLGALAERTIAPLTAALDGVDRLVVAPHGAWHRVPFAALPFRGRRLVDACSLETTPSLGALTGAVPEAGGRPLVLDFADGLAPTIAAEGRALARLVPDALHLHGESATTSALRTAEPPRFVHIAAHGRFRSDVPAMSGVRLADGWLRAVDFHSLALRGSVVVLSGCETGVSRVDAGGEVQGLVRGVFASGASDLVVSLWRVDDAATADLMTSFHRHFARGASAGRALAAAQREAATAGLSPWHWAGFGTWTRRLTS